ncbi:MAG: adenosine deaminase, partial [Legionellales bacterium]
LDSVFTQVLTAFEAVSQSKNTLVGVNLVQPENGIRCLTDYRKQMEILNYFHNLYPEVHITLHAGELAPESVIPEELSYHIHDALFTGHAQRIGHGVDIAYENGAESIANYMSKQQIPVEINLISNHKILNVSGPNHPLNYYLAHKVPVVLSTDDEGILRTDLTNQYVEAARVHGLDYPTLKQINRNALTYAFVPGKSIWANPYKAEAVVDCQDLHSVSCRAFIKNNEKAQLQWDLEEQLVAFERAY